MLSCVSHCCDIISCIALLVQDDYKKGGIPERKVEPPPLYPPLDGLESIRQLENPTPIDILEAIMDDA